MPTILFELFYTIWPAVAAFSQAPFFLFLLPFALLDSLQLVKSDRLFLELLSMWQAVECTSALLFLEYMGAKIFQTFGVIRSTPHSRTWVKVAVVHFPILFFLSRWELSQLSVRADLTTENHFFVLFPFLGVCSLFFFLPLFVLKTGRKILLRLRGVHDKNQNSNSPSLLLTFLIALYPLIAVLTVWIWLVADPPGFPHGLPHASRFFVLNAAIKNTCYTDPRRQNCPHTLEEIGYIEPAEFREKLKGTQMQYVYDANENLYTFVVRYRPTQAVVFDPRLIKTTGVDFKEYYVSVIGQDTLISPPDHPGPWTFPDWKY